MLAGGGSDVKSYLHLVPLAVVPDLIMLLQLPLPHSHDLTLYPLTLYLPYLNPLSVCS